MDLDLDITTAKQMSMIWRREWEANGRPTHHCPHQAIGRGNPICGVCGRKLAGLDAAIAQTLGEADETVESA